MQARLQFNNCCSGVVVLLINEQLCSPSPKFFQTVLPNVHKWLGVIAAKDSHILVLSSCRGTWGEQLYLEALCRVSDLSLPAHWWSPCTIDFSQQESKSARISCTKTWNAQSHLGSSGFRLVGTLLVTIQKGVNLDTRCSHAVPSSTRFAQSGKSMPSGLPHKAIQTAGGCALDSPMYRYKAGSGVHQRWSCRCFADVSKIILDHHLRVQFHLWVFCILWLTARFVNAPGANAHKHSTLNCLINQLIIESALTIPLPWDLFVLLLPIPYCPKLIAAVCYTPTTVCSG